MLADCGAQGERVWARHPGTEPPLPGQLRAVMSNRLPGPYFDDETGLH